MVPNQAPVVSVSTSFIPPLPRGSESFRIVDVAGIQYSAYVPKIDAERSKIAAASLRYAE
jgi:hypothetical protein